MASAVTASAMQVEGAEYDPKTADRAEPFYVRYYSGHAGKFGHEFLGT